MRFEQVTLDDLLGEIRELPSDWMDETAREVVAQIQVTGRELRKAGREITAEDLARLLEGNPEFLDVCRLFLARARRPWRTRSPTIWRDGGWAGRGWFNRQSDLQHIVGYHQEGLIDMIYTQTRLGEMAETVLHVYENE